MVGVSNEEKQVHTTPDRVISVMGESARVVNLVDLANSLTHKHDVSNLIHKGRTQYRMLI